MENDEAIVNKISKDPYTTNQIKSNVYEVLNEFINERDKTCNIELCALPKLNETRFGIMLDNCYLITDKSPDFYERVLGHSLIEYQYKRFGEEGSTIPIDKTIEYSEAMSKISQLEENYEIAQDFIDEFLNENKDSLRQINTYIDSTNYCNYIAHPYYIFARAYSEEEISKTIKTGNIGVVDIVDASTMKYSESNLNIPTTIFCDSIDLLNDLCSINCINKMEEKYCIDSNIKIHIASIGTEVFKNIYFALPENNDLISKGLILYASNKALFKLAKDAGILKDEYLPLYTQYMTTPYNKSHEYNLEIYAQDEG